MKPKPKPPIPKKRRPSGRPLLMPIGTPSNAMVSSTPSRKRWPRPERDGSTVSCPLNPQALPGRLRFPGSWHVRAPRSPLLDRLSSQGTQVPPLWGNWNGRLAQGSCGRNSVGANRPDRATKSQGNLYFSGGYNGGQDSV